MQLPPGHPVLSFDSARALERRLLGDDESAQWSAMQRAGQGVAAGVLRDFDEIGGFPAAGRMLVLAGKGNNAGDALIAAHRVLECFPEATADVMFAFGEQELRPLARRAWRELSHGARKRVTAGRMDDRPAAYDLCLDGVFGFSFRPPMPPEAAALIERANAGVIRLRAAVDLPSGLDESEAAALVFRADFTYAAGSVKIPLVNATHAPNVGRLRYLDLGFFTGEKADSRLHVLTREVLDPLRVLRDPSSDKRTFGHLFIVCGSRQYPGAALMAALAALRSGVGLVTVFAPESLVPAFAARAPEAMWVGWPETPAGGLALEGRDLLDERWTQAAAIMFGPGLGRELETLALAADIATHSPVPMVIDADALQPDIVRAGTAPRILTPHRGEFRRIQGDDFHFHASPATREAVVVLKGRLTDVTWHTQNWYSPFGGPVLARGGSGDMLAGMIGGLLAQSPAEPLLAACRGAVWHGLAADHLARAKGQVAVNTTQLLDYFPAALRI
jgi:ADP-dependent NAD(P)H-hydrate dehydratase / NAD(P)H-hydrate epimerase